MLTFLLRGKILTARSELQRLGDRRRHPETAGLSSIGYPGGGTIGTFNGALLKNEHRITPRKSIVICGAARGGTTFAASVFLRLGVPFTRSPDDPISARLEHGGLKAAFQAQDAAALQSVMTDFRNRYPVWAWKLPAIERRFSTIATILPDPHFVLVFKEPLSVAARVAERKGKNPFAILKNVLQVYQRMSDITAVAEHPLLVVSYEKAMADLPAFLKEAARFAGIPSFDEDAVVAGVHGDAARYFDGWPTPIDTPA